MLSEEKPYCGGDAVGGSEQGGTCGEGHKKWGKKGSMTRLTGGGGKPEYQQKRKGGITRRGAGKRKKPSLQKKKAWGQVKLVEVSYAGL